MGSSDGGCRDAKGVVGQDKCHLFRFTMLSDPGISDGILDRATGGLLASMYFLTVLLWIPNALAIPRIDNPLRFAFCTAFHLSI